MDSIVFELDGNIPPKKNNKQIFRGKNGRPIIVPQKNYKIWHRAASLMISLQKWDYATRVAFPIEKCEYIDVTLFYGSRHAKDNTNTVESVHDLLVDVGILKDDCWQVTGRTSQIPEFREKKPGCRISIGIK